jgi:hypothetical protein
MACGLVEPTGAVTALPVEPAGLGVGCNTLPQSDCVEYVPFTSHWLSGASVIAVDAAVVLRAGRSIAIEAKNPVVLAEPLMLLSLAWADFFYWMARSDIPDSPAINNRLLR